MLQPQSLLLRLFVARVFAVNSTHVWVERQLHVSACCDVVSCDCRRQLANCQLSIWLQFAFPETLSLLHKHSKCAPVTVAKLRNNPACIAAPFKLQVPQAALLALLLCVFAQRKAAMKLSSESSNESSFDLNCCRRRVFCSQQESVCCKQS